MPADTQDGKPLFTLNGIQTQSGSVVNLLPLWREAEAAGVGVMRVSPRPADTGAVIAGARAALDAEGTPERGADLDPRECNGYWYGRAGLERVLES